MRPLQVKSTTLTMQGPISRQDHNEKESGRRSDVRTPRSSHSLPSFLRCCYGRKKWSWLIAWERTTTKYFKKPILCGLVFLARTAALHPGKTVLLTIAVSVALVVTGLHTNFHVTTDQRILWTPEGSPTHRHGNFVNENFPAPQRSIRFMLHSYGENVLTLNVAQCLFDAVDSIRSTNGYEANCLATWNATDCPLLSASRFFDHNRSVFLDRTRVLEQEDVVVDGDHAVRIAMSPLEYPNGERVVRPFIFGLSQPDLSIGNTNDNQLQFAASFIGDMRLSPSEATSKGFEANLISNVYALNDRWVHVGAPCRLELSTPGSFDAEIKRGIYNDIPYLATAFILMGSFSAFYFSNFSNCVQSRSVLGLGAVATIVCSIMTSFGLMFCIGIPFHSITQVFPYVMVGIGLDDTFIILGAWSRADQHLNIADRVGKTMEDIGISITMSTLTTVVAFFLGAASSYPIIQWFCWYAAPTVAIDFVYQITFFIAILVYDERRINDNRYDCLVCLRKTNTASTTERNKKPNFMTRLMHRYSRFLMQPTSKMIVLVIFAAMLVVGAFGASQQGQDMDFRVLIPVDSYVRTFYDSLYTYSSPESTGFLRAGIYFRDVNVSSMEVRGAMEDYINDMVKIPFISDPPQLCWLRDLENLASAKASLAELPFNDQVTAFLQTEPFATAYADDVIRDQKGNVLASRCHVAFDQGSLFDIQLQIQMLHSQRKVSQAQAINRGRAEWAFFTYGEVFSSWELYDTIIEEVLVNVLLGLASVFFMSLLFIPHPIGALLLTPVVAAIYCELLGMLHFAGITINGVSVTGLTMSIGLVVDYNAHIVFTYCETKGETSRNDRIHKVLMTMGTSILLGGFTTLLGVLPLSFTQSEIFRVFFFTFLGISGLSTLHGMIFVPVVLSLVGPQEICEGNEEQERMEIPDTKQSTRRYEIVEL